MIVYMITLVSCGDPGIPDNAVRIGSSFLYQDEVTFVCNDGYYQSSGPAGGVRQCLDTGLWSDVQPICSCKHLCSGHFYYFDHGSFIDVNLY